MSVTATSEQHPSKRTKKNTVVVPYYRKMKLFLLSLLFLVLTAAVVVESFATTATTTPSSLARSGVVLAVSSSSTTSTSTADKNPTTKPLRAERYIASNRFSVRRGKEARFEKRWATRKSRLAELDGFRYFHLMRRVTIDNDEGTGTTEYDNGGGDKEAAFGNYVSLTVWENKGNFNAWRKGDAFKEAHGGTSIGAFVSTMVGSALTLRGAPKPAFYDGILFQNSGAPEFVPETVGGWRSDAGFPEDGKGTCLPAECFVACNQFFVPKENAVAFEQRWKNRESKLKECDGFVWFSMLRRDNKQKGHGTVEMDENTEPTYLSTTIWKDRASFDKWRTGANFSKAHGQKPSSDEKKKDDGEAPKKPPAQQGGGGPPQWTRPPQPIFYEGTLVITAADGA